MTANLHIKKFNEYTRLNAAYPAKYAAELTDAENKAALVQLLEYFENHVFQCGSTAAEFWGNMFVMPLYTGVTPTGKQIYTRPHAGEFIRSHMGKNCLKIWQYAKDYYTSAALIHEQIKTDLPHKYDPYNEDLPYTDAWNIAEHIADSTLAGNIPEARKWLCIADELCSSENIFLSALGQAGYIEDLQNIFLAKAENNAQEKQLYELMGSAAQKAWSEIKRS